jgi:hypothetical protein
MRTGGRCAAPCIVVAVQRRAQKRAQVDCEQCGRTLPGRVIEGGRVYCEDCVARQAEYEVTRGDVALRELRRAVLTAAGVTSAEQTQQACERYVEEARERNARWAAAGYPNLQDFLAPEPEAPGALDLHPQRSPVTRRTASGRPRPAPSLG